MVYVNCLAVTGRKQAMATSFLSLSEPVVNQLTPCCRGRARDGAGSDGDQPCLALNLLTRIL